MGDRANIRIIQRQGGLNHDEEAIYLYTHWGGEELPQVLARALAQHECWADEVYLARIIFCEMIKGQEAEARGFGISTYITDNEHPILNVDCKNQTVNGVPFGMFIKQNLEVQA